MPDALNPRSRRVLRAAVAQYIETGRPVGSKALVEAARLEHSPATTRAVLRDLEERGYLTHPHTSAGRVPTDSGFRFYARWLVHRQLGARSAGLGVAETDRRAVERQLAGREGGLEAAEEAGRLLSRLCGAAAVVTAGRPEDERLAELRFVVVGERRLLAVLVTEAGAVHHRPLEGVALGQRELERVHAYLGDKVRGYTLRALRDRVARERDPYGTLRESVSNLLERAAAAEAERVEVVVAGKERLFDRPELDDVHKLRAFLRAIEDRTHLLALLDETLEAPGVLVRIGSEAGLGGLDDVGVISSGYGAGARHAGSLCVLGPVRMDYDKVVPLVAFTATVLGGGRGPSARPS